MTTAVILVLSIQTFPTRHTLKDTDLHVIQLLIARYKQVIPRRSFASRSSRYTIYSSTTSPL